MTLKICFPLPHLTSLIQKSPPLLFSTAPTTTTTTTTHRLRWFTPTMGSSQDDINGPLLVSASESVPPPDSSEAKYYEYSVQLERVLSNTDVPFLKRLPEATWIEMKLLFRLAAPAAAVYLINYVMSMVTQIFSGHLGNLELAAASLGNNGIQTFAYGIMVFSTRSHYLH